MAFPIRKTNFLLIWISLSLIGTNVGLASETGQARQFQALQDQQAADSRFADFFSQLKKSPKDARIHFGLAQVYLEKGLLELAKESFLRALMLEKGMAKAHRGLSQVYRKKNIKSWEVYEMETVVALAPERDQYRYELAVLYMEPDTFDYKKAKKQYKILKKKESPLAVKLAKIMQIETK